MFRESFSKTAFGGVKIVFLAAVVIIGVVFMPQDIILKVQEARDAVALYVQNTVQVQTPAIEAKLAEEVVKLKAEATGAYQKAKVRTNEWLNIKIREEVDRKINEIFKTNQQNNK